MIARRRVRRPRRSVSEMAWAVGGTIVMFIIGVTIGAAVSGRIPL